MTNSVNLRSVSYLLGLVMATAAVLMLIPATIYTYENGPAVNPFLKSAIICFSSGALLVITNYNNFCKLNLRDGFFITTFSWIVFCFCCSLPFHFSALNLNLADAFFESASGLTTTGGTVITSLDKAPKSILLWRAMLELVGGIGIMALVLIALPALQLGGMQLFHRESSDSYDKFLPKTKQILLATITVYALLTISCILCYKIFGMSIFDAICHAFGTVATGGLSNYDNSFEHFNNPKLEWAGTIFMILGGTPFLLYAKIFMDKKIQHFWQDTQVRYFLGVISLLTIILSTHLVSKFSMPIADAIRLSCFNIVSLITTTGFVSADYSNWGFFACGILFTVMFIGGCTGSSSGGIKIMRFLILFKGLSLYTRKLYRPHEVHSFKIKQQTISNKSFEYVAIFISAYLITFLAISILMLLLGNDLVTSVSGTIANLGNIGPGFGTIVGPAGNYHSINNSSKILLAFAMIIGRLELFTFYTVFTLSFWSNKYKT